MSEQNDSTTTNSLFEGFGEASRRFFWEVESFLSMPVQKIPWGDIITKVPSFDSMLGPGDALSVLGLVGGVKPNASIPFSRPLAQQATSDLSMPLHMHNRWQSL